MNSTGSAAITISSDGSSTLVSDGSFTTAVDMTISSDDAGDGAPSPDRTSSNVSDSDSDSDDVTIRNAQNVVDADAQYRGVVVHEAASNHRMANQNRLWGSSLLSVAERGSFNGSEFLVQELQESLKRRDDLSQSMHDTDASITVAVNELLSPHSLAHTTMDGLLSQTTVALPQRALFQLSSIKRVETITQHILQFGAEIGALAKTMSMVLHVLSLEHAIVLLEQSLSDTGIEDTMVLEGTSEVHIAPHIRLPVIQDFIVLATSTLNHLHSTSHVLTASAATLAELITAL
ncbi:hypothetical protein EIP91_004918 [Steccherinum ochraceum]|uniref:Uncharacterized protein n=1 Tax=Steccherinum ochraceum TaxID=92696 RepID=A0A4R0RAZ9_9APHY|nr:hypothetical protein EIP91_004918 [Steccherinum ochraceum]